MTNKTALVTGASGGIGEAIAIKLASEGYNIIVHYNGNERKANEVCSKVETYNVKAKAIKCDISKFDDVKEMVAEILNDFDTIDVLVNNSGITKDGLLLRMTDEDFDAVIDVNLKGAFNCIKHVSKIMMKQRSGAIVNMASVIGLIGNIGQTNYAASKGGLIAMSKSVAKELASRNIRCNVCAPGFIETPMTDVLSDTVKENILKNIPLNKLGSPNDVSECVAFLVSDKASYITGQVLNVDGGMVV